METLHPPESFSMGKFPSRVFALLQWNDPNQSAVSFELEWRFSDVPYWVHLASTSPGAPLTQPTAQAISRRGITPAIAIGVARSWATQRPDGRMSSATTWVRGSHTCLPRGHRLQRML